jgi:hypothetical protein
MAISSVVPRPDVSGAAVNTALKSTAPPPAHVARASVPASSGLDAPATTAHLSGVGLIMGLIRAYESQHPDQTKAFLLSIADKLLADAPHAGTFAPNLKAWGEAFLRAADTGDLSNIWPNAPATAHFGVQAYQAASQPPANAVTAMDAVLRGSLSPLASGATASELEAATGQLLGSVLRHSLPPPAQDISRDNSAAYDVRFLGHAYAHRLSLRRRHQRHHRRYHQQRRRRRRYRSGETGSP